MLIHGLEKGAIGSAVLTDSNGGLSPAGKIARNRSEVLACAGSRYSASGGLAALNRTLKKGETRLAVVGLPCQMEALARMEASEPDGKERSQRIALRIGLFCTWALDYRHLDAFLEAKGVSDHVTKYDIPPPPAEVFQVDTGQGMREFPLSDVRELVQKGCALCEDMTSEWADVSVGAVEGQTTWNTLIVRTDAGEELVRELMKSGHLETNELPPENLEHLNEAAANKRQRAIQAKRDRAGSQP
jgi:coenzyme F420 hydrogenase subunit beta